MSSSLRKVTSIEDLRALAQRRVPRAFFQYADHGSYTQSTLRANRDDLARQCRGRGSSCGRGETRLRVVFGNKPGGALGTAPPNH